MWTLPGELVEVLRTIEGATLYVAGEEEGGRLYLQKISKNGQPLKTLWGETLPEIMISFASIPEFSGKDLEVVLKPKGSIVRHRASVKMIILREGVTGQELVELLTMKTPTRIEESYSAKTTVAILGPGVYVRGKPYGDGIMDPLYFAAFDHDPWKERWCQLP